MISALTPMGRRLAVMCSGVIACIFSDLPGEEEFSEDLVLVTAEALPQGTIERSELNMWSSIHNAWMEIQANPPGTLRAWRVIHEYGREIPGLNVFRLPAGGNPRYFYLLPKMSTARAKKQVISLLIVLSSLWHAERGWGIFHASGVTRNGEVLLFLGSSGAGKTTAANHARARGYEIIHDDHMLIRTGGAGATQVTTYGQPARPLRLRGIFCLNQSGADRLEPLAPMTTARRLLDSFFDFGIRQALSGQYLERALGISADIARRVPGYDLYFRKSGDFLDLIDEATGAAAGG